MRAKGVLLYLLFCAIFIATLVFRPWEQTAKRGGFQPKPISSIEQKPKIDFSDLPDQPETQTLTSAEIFRRARPSVVLLTMQDARGQPLSLGSGFFIDKDVVATNFHVIDGASGGYANVIGESTKLNIKGTLGVDPFHDLALLQVDPSPTTYLLVMPKLSVNVGDTVYAIGNPQGLEGTFSEGIISSVRVLGSDRVLQITAPISPGSSGGPVLNEYGIVIGVSFASVANGQNLNFAMPSEYLAALQAAKIELQPLIGPVPRAKLHKTLPDRTGNERPLAGVVGENFTWGQRGEFSFSLHNKLVEDISKVRGFVIFHNPEGEAVDSVPLRYDGIIAAQSAKRLTGEVDLSVADLCNAFYWWDESRRIWRKQERMATWEVPRHAKTETRHGKVEFRILDFSVE